MPTLCAKPSCTEPVQRWLDFAPTDRRVIERSSRGETSIGLCASHADRFTVPRGWEYEGLTTVSGPPQADTGVSTPPATVSKPAVNRAYTRDQPWFLALSDTAAPELGHDDTELVTAIEPTAGSLLHRAFHGPDRADDAQRAAVDELETRRAARQDDDASSAIELPFPPFESETRIAVS